MKRVLIIGCSGSGKSTFARKLRDKTNLPLIYLDMIWHKKDKTTVSRKEFDEKIEEIIKEQEWILDGNYTRTLEERLIRCDTVILFDLPLEICLKGVESRILKPREDMPWIEDKFDEDFRQWILDFPKEKLPKIYNILQKYQEQKTIVIFKSREQAQYYLDNLKV